MNHTICKYLLASVALIYLTPLMFIGCSSDEVEPGEPFVLIEEFDDDTSPPDMAAPDLAEMAADMKIAPDMGAPSIAIDQALWETPASSCARVRDAEKSEEMFAKPPFYPNPYVAKGYGPATREELLKIAPSDGNGNLKSGVSVSARSIAEHISREDWQYNFYAEEDEDFTFYMSVGNNSDDYGPQTNTRIVATMMVDYQPVEFEAELRHGSLEAEPTLYKGRGFVFAPLDQFFFLTFHIPAEAFPEARTYEIAMGLEQQREENMANSMSERFEFHHGGYDLIASPCFEEPLQARPTEYELLMMREHVAGRNDTMLFLADQTDRDTAEQLKMGVEPFQAQPGEVIPLNLSYVARPMAFASLTDVPQVFVPTLDGEPVGPAWHVTGRIPDGSIGWIAGEGLIDARKSFEVQMPEEPGIYHVAVMSWVGTFERYIPRGGGPRGGKIDDSDASSNIIRIEVVDEAANAE